MIDVVLIVLVLLAAYGGWRQGLVSSALSAAGWLAGLLFGFWATPGILSGLGSQPESDLTTAMVVLVSALVLGVIGAAVLGALGRAISAAIDFAPIRLVDAGLGAIAMSVVVLVAAWAAMTSARPLLSAEVTQSVDDSAAWRVLDDAVPDVARESVNRLGERFADTPFPEVFSADEPQVEVPEADRAIITSPAIERARASVVKVRGISQSCEGMSVGSGWVVSDNRIVTNAHVVAGSGRVTVQVGGEGQRLRATVVAFDSDLDLAILRVPGLDAPALPRTPVLKSGTQVVAAGFPHGDHYTTSAGRIRTETLAIGQDVYNRKPVNRQIYTIRTTIVPGNSGGPLLTSTGQVAGTVFARSAEDPSTGYALTDGATDGLLDQAPGLVRPVATGACLSR